MSHFGDLCAQGLDLTLDVGFPTVSLPVQHALFTGLTQEQSGVQFRVTRIEPPVVGIPGAVFDSVAVVEAHPEIAGSFAFARVEPSGAQPLSIDAPIPPGWREGGFDAAVPKGLAKTSADVSPRGARTTRKSTKTKRSHRTASSAAE